MKKRLKNSLYYLILGCWYLLSLLPFRVLYLFSDCLYLLIYYGVRYRKKLVRKNLAESFPEKNRKEIIRIEKKFYRFFCDYIVETIKLLTIRKENMRKRMRFEDVEQLEKSFSEGKSCCLYLGHYCNWEWISSLPMYLPEGIVSGQIYHVLENEVFDRLFLRIRGRFGAESIPMEKTLRKIVTYKRENKKMVIGFISDQVPVWSSVHYWTNFLNHDTPVLSGTERIARQADFAAFYASISRPRRGFYVCELKKLTDRSNDLPEFGLTEMYFRELEKEIIRTPQYWLWTHNRWKRTREEFIRIFGNKENPER